MSIKCLVLLMFLLMSLNLHAEEFLNMVTPPGSFSMGDAFTANSSGADSCWLNPAGLSKSYVNEYSAGGARLTGGVKLWTGSAVMPFSFGTLGVGLGWLGRESEEFEDALGNFTGKELNFNNLIITAGYGREIYNIPLGINFKFVNSSFAMEKKMLVLADAGGMYRIGSLDLGLMLRNFGISTYEPGNWGEIRAGAGMGLYSSKDLDVRVVGDIYTSYEHGTRFTAGSELELFQIAAFRAGFNPTGYNQFQFGAGFNLNVSQWKIKIDYGINPAFDGLNMSHIFQITVSSRTKELVMKTKSHLDKADSYINSDNYGEAEKEIKEALKTSPDDPKLKQMINTIEKKKKEKQAVMHVNNAEKYMKLKKYENAKNELEKAIKLNPENKTAHCELGKIYFEQGNYSKALERFRKALEIDADYEEARKMEELIAEKVEKQKPIWLKEDKYYEAKKLVFEDFETEAIISKFYSSEGEFIFKSDDKSKYAEWQMGKTKENKVLKTAIRLPDLSKFKGIILSLKSDDIKVVELVLVEQKDSNENLWIVPVSGINDKWRSIQIPFHYFQFPGKPNASIDLGKIVQFRFVVDKDQEGELGIDNVEFYH